MYQHQVILNSPSAKTHIFKWDCLISQNSWTTQPFIKIILETFIVRKGTSPLDTFVSNDFCENVICFSGFVALQIPK